MFIPIPTIVWFPLFAVLIVVGTGIFALIGQMIWGNTEKSRVSTIAAIGLSFAAVTLLTFASKEEITFGEQINFDRLALVGQLMTVISALVVVLISPSYLKEKGIKHGEFYPLLLWATAGGMLICSTRNLLMLFIGIELLSISLYVLAGLSRGEKKSEEAALKYFLLGAFATGFLLYGIAFFYGATGNLEMSTALTYWQRDPKTSQPLLSIAFALITVGIAFKASLVPFHQWTPDVYEGAPTNVVAFMATGGKIGVFVALWNFADSFGNIGKFVFATIAGLSVVSMFVGNILAMGQKNIKRLLAYSSIANAGYVAVSAATVAADHRQNHFSVSYFLVGYTLTTLGVFVVLAMLANKGEECTNVSDLRGLSRRSPLAAGLLLICVLSLIGLGPVSGFLGKFIFVRDAYAANLLPLAVVFVLNSVFGAFYYFGLVRAAYSPADAEIQPIKLDPQRAVAFAVCAFGVVGTFVFFTPFMKFIGFR